MIASVVDCHVRVFSDHFGLERWIEKSPLKAITGISFPEQINSLRKQTRQWLKPLSNSLHGMNTMLRHLPEFARDGFDELSGWMPLPSLMVESTLFDLKEAMDGASVNYALVIAQPPLISNEFVLSLCARNPQLIPAVSIPKGKPYPGRLLRRYVEEGAKVLSIHPAFESEDADSPRYRAILRAASRLGLPVMIQTGRVSNHFLYRNPSRGRAENFAKWFEHYPKIPFILAHMNFHQPYVAIDLCEKYENLYLETSRQPAEVVGEAVRRLGAERVLFGTDWPIMGNNMVVGRKRVEDCIGIGLLNQEQAKLILGGNAMKLLGISADAPTR